MNIKLEGTYRKNFFFCMLLFVVCNFAYAQNALDFNITTSGGEEFNLYEQLEKGNTVVLDFFFADCTPCQRVTTAMAKLNQQLLDSGKSLVVLGISDRDPDSTLKQFDSTYGVNYISCGTQGGGDTVTQLYKSWFSFTGWPTYAVICTDKRVAWDMKREESFEELRQNIDTCMLTSGIEQVLVNAPKAYPNPVENMLYLPLNTTYTKLEIVDLRGKTQVSVTSNETKEGVNVEHLSPGTYYLFLYNKGHKSSQHIIKIDL
jgi:thiol-disulfide isomerase/thioredoxin